MINPTECVDRIIRNSPESLQDCLDLMIWAGNNQNLQLDNDYDEVLEKLFARTKQSRKARAEYVENRIAA